jgi:hypothetical protein
MRLEEVDASAGVISRLTTHSVIAAASFAVLFDFRVHHAHVSGQRVVARKRLLLATHRTPDLVLAVVVDGILVTRQVVRSGEDGVARLIRRWVDARTLVRTGLRVAGLDGRGSHARWAW